MIKSSKLNFFSYSQFLGPEAQASISKYLARYPLSGQSRLKLVLEKNDLKGYHVRGLIRNEGGKTTLDLLFEAEGKQTLYLNYWRKILS